MTPSSPDCGGAVKQLVTPYGWPTKPRFVAVWYASAYSVDLPCMWCRHCQQDVPVVAPTSRSHPTCPRCRRELRRPTAAAASPSPSETGIELDAIDAGAFEDGAPLYARDPDERIRRIRRGLRPVYRLDLGINTGSEPRNGAAPPPIVASRRRPTGVVGKRKSRRSPVTWTLSALLAAGSASLAAGLGGLAWATANANDVVWHGSMTATIAGEAGLILGLTIMAIRLWQNSRKLNIQLDGVDDQLAEIQYATGRLAHARQSCSQAYYDHFGAAASPPMALAHLRGQLDQLTARISR